MRSYLKHSEYEAFFKNRFLKDIEKAKNTHLIPKIKQLISIVIQDPFQTHPPYEKLQGYQNTYSRRINKQHRLIYSVDKNAYTISFDSCWGHYK